MPTELPEGFRSWREYNEKRLEKRKQKQEYFIQKLEKQKQKELAERDAPAPKPAPKKKECEEPSTLSIAVPGSILENAQSAELRTYLAGQLARAACVFKVDEVIVYDDIGVHDSTTVKTEAALSDSGEVRSTRKSCAQLARILQYLECPQYLRKEFFPNHRDLDYAGLLNPLDAPHHMRLKDETRFREGVVVNQPVNNGSLVNAGLLQNVKVDRAIQPGVRVTVEMLPSPPESKRLFGRVVPPSRPHKETGIYWGYSVRIANSLNAVLLECPYKEGYDVTMGTSERGNPIEHVSLPSHHHALVVFGGLAGIEAALEADDVLTEDNPALIFDHYLNVCPNQGSRTIRTEEAILIALAELRTRLKPKVSYMAEPKEEKPDRDTSVGSDDDSHDGDFESKIVNETSTDTSSNNDNSICHNGSMGLNMSSKSCTQNSETEKVQKRRKKMEKCHGEGEVSTDGKRAKEDFNELEIEDQGASIETEHAPGSEGILHKKPKKKRKSKSEDTVEELNSNENTSMACDDTVDTNVGVQVKSKKKKKRETVDPLSCDQNVSMDMLDVSETDAEIKSKPKKKKRKSES